MVIDQLVVFAVDVYSREKALPVKHVEFPGRVGTHRDDVRVVADTIAIIEGGHWIVPKGGDHDDLGTLEPGDILCDLLGLMLAVFTIHAKQEYHDRGVLFEVLVCKNLPGRCGHGKRRDFGETQISGL